MAGDWSWLETDGSETPVSLEWNDGDPLQAAGLFVGRDINDDAIIEPLTTSAVGEPLPPAVPRAPSLTVTQTSRTTADIAWTPAPVNGSPVTNWIVQRRSSTDDGANFGAWGGVLASPFPADVFTTSETSLPTGTPEIVFQYQAWGVNGDGAGDISPIATIQFGGPGGAVPPNPNNLTVVIQSSTSVFLDWTAAVDLTVDKCAIYKGNVLFRDNLDATATAYQRNDVEPAVPQLNVNIRRFNEFGWSGGTNWIDFTTPGAPRVWPDDPVMGQSTPDESPPYRTQISALRIYTLNRLISEFNQWSPRVIGFTDDQFGGPTSGGIVGRTEDALIAMYEGTASQTAGRQNCEMHVALGNEIDRPPWDTGPTPAGLVSNYSDLRDVVWQTVGGQRRFPNASVWIDMTANNIRSTGAGARFKPVAQYLDGHAASYYPAGRRVQDNSVLLEYNTNAYPAGSIWNGNSRNNYTFYVDPITTMITDWRNTGGPGGTSIRSQLNQLACWEIGIPIHHSLTGTNAPWIRTGADASDMTQKPRYLVGGARTSGPANEQYNFEGLLNHIQAYCQQQDISMREMLYWNQQSDPEIPNLWQSDATQGDPPSVEAWYQWTPGFRLPNI